MTRAEILCLAATVIAAVVFTLLERVVPYDAGQRLLRDGFWTDFVLYAVLQNWALGVLIGRFIGWLGAHTDWTVHAPLRAWPVWVQVAFFVVTHDIYIYLFHRLQHQSALLWRIHEAHHSAVRVDWLSGARSHALEIFINQTVEFAPIILLGAAPVVPVVKGTISAVWGMFIHANLDVRLGPLQYVINGPEMHRWHHADDERVYHKNFSTKFALWDWLLGTAFYPTRPRRKAARYGLHGMTYPERFPLAYFQHHALSARAGESASAEGQPDDTNLVQGQAAPSR